MKIKVFLVLILIGIFSLSILFSKTGTDPAEDKVEAKLNQESVSNVPTGGESVFLLAGSTKVDLVFEDNGSEICEESLEELEEDELNRDIKDKKTLAQSSDKQISEPEADVAGIPLNDGTEWKPTEALFAEYVRLYPNVEVKQQFNEMRA